MASLTPDEAGLAPVIPEGTAPTLLAARERLRDWRDRAAASGHRLRAFPPEPMSCCARGCNGCVWEGWLDAVAFWCEDAEQAVAASAPPGIAPGYSSP